jgi:cytochrome c
MRRSPELLGVLSIAALAAFNPAGAGDPERPFALAERRGCLQCHDVSETRIGPSFHAIADRYRSDPEAEGRLIDWLETGGRGHWGENSEMPEQSRLRPGDARTLVRWLLGQ